MCGMSDVGPTKGYELINSGEVESYLDGSARMIVVASIEAYVYRQRAKARNALLAKWPVKPARRRAEVAEAAT